MSNFLHNSRVDQITRRARACVSEHASIRVIGREYVSCNAGEEIEWLAMRGTEQLVVFVKIPKGTFDVVGFPGRFAVMQSVPVGIVHIVLLIEQRASRIRLVENMHGLIVRSVDVIV